MGLGDDIMAVGQAIKLGLRDGGCVIGRSPQRPRKSAVLEHLRWVNCEGARHFLRDSAGCRGYIDYARSDAAHYAFNESYRVHPGELNLSPERERVAQSLPKRDERPIVAIHTEVKRSISGTNRAWPMMHWLELAKGLLASGYHVWQIDPPSAMRLTSNIPHTCFGRGAPKSARNVLYPPGLREALYALSCVDLVVCPEDIYHHAAAALGVPAVVVWGGRTNVDVLGYEMHTNVTNREEWCGRRTYCDHCHTAMAEITPERVLEAVEGALVA